LGGTRSWSPRRGIALLAVAAAHAALITALFLGLTQVPRSSVEEYVSTWVVLPGKSARPRLRAPPARPPLLRVKPITIDLPPPAPQLAPGSGDRGIDWDAEARDAAERALTVPERHPFGPSRTGGPRAAHPAPPPHHRGESYRDELGDRIYWVSDRCYLVSESRLPGALTTPGPAALTRTVCVGSDAPSGELFKDLPAYKRYHPE
jgi:hypothetical protein